MRSRLAALLVSLALLTGTALVANLTSVGAAVPGCPCVLLIEVDGLEPKDVTRETTPFLWELAHPDEGQQIEDSRAGWTWQAPRSVMSAGTAANAAALLTGSYPEQSGIPADEFTDPSEASKVRLQYKPIDAEQLGLGHFDSESLLDTLPLESEATGKKDAAVFVGNPALSEIANSENVPAALRWWPTTGFDGEDPDPENPPSPAYCEAPRDTPEDPNAPREPVACSAPDVVTLNRALSALNSDGSRVALSYIHLAELGVIKRRDGDVAPSDYAEEGSPAAAQSLPHELAHLDAALAQFIARYKDQTQSPTTGAKWEDTFVMVVGNHGYETSPQVKRLPSPDGSTSDLESYVEADGRLQYSSYGSMATIHATQGSPDERRAAIESIVPKLRQDGPVQLACGAMSNGEKCIQEVLYVRDDVVPPTTAGDAKRMSVEHPNWHFDHLSRDEPFTPTRASGELVILTEPGWATGRGIPSEEDDSADPGLIDDNPDPYLGVSGGPRNRAVAAIINGPGGEQGMRQVPVDHYPVTAGADTGELDPSPTAAYDSVFAANADPRDDTGAVGHERQPEVVDFAPTIAALLGIGIDSEQLAGRFLQEAFQRELAFPSLEEPPEEPPPPPPPPPEEVFVEPAPEVIILPPPPTPEPPPPPKPWSYQGLIRNLRADVGDRKGHIFPKVPSRSALSYLILRADFGKPLSSVKLSFYKQQRTTKARSGRRRTVVRTLASFAPFSIKRAKNAKLTLKVPKVFKPTHVGVVVQRARRLTGREAAAARRRKQPLFKAYGARVGGIYRVKNARRLHTVAPKRSARRPRR